jgi:deoxyadenosine/deoxycytidine kinase
LHRDQTLIHARIVSKLVIVVGNAGVGKTTLTRLLCTQGGLFGGLEQGSERPFQALFVRDLTRYALPNQVDYLLLRAEQEWAIRRQPVTGIQDGGLDLDFQLFTRRFHQRGYLSDAEFALCARFYAFCRQLLPPPDLIIRLAAPLAVIAERYRRRNRPLEIAQLEDLAAMETLIDDWLQTVTTTPVLVIDATADDPTYSAHLPDLLARINAL